MAKEIIWSHKARIKLFAILEFYAKRNGNKKFSSKLYQKFTREINLLVKHPELGMRSPIENVRGLIVLEYVIFYESNEYQIIIHSIWPTKQNPDQLKIL